MSPVKLRQRQLGPFGTVGTPSRASWLIAALLFLALFVVWTQYVRTSITHGGRETAWVAQEFGTWPERFTTIDGTWDAVLSLVVSFEGDPPLAPVQASAETDGNNSNYLNGSRFVTGPRAGRATSVSVHVGAPIAPPPNNEFEIAIYSDQAGAPAWLLTRSARGRLDVPGWQTAPIEADLAPDTPYWLFYNTNGTTTEVNNMTYTPGRANPLDRAIRGLQSTWLRSIVTQFASWGSLTPTAALALILAAAIAWRRPARGALLLVAFVAGLAVVGALKVELAYPFTGYPSGHVFRAAFIAIALVELVRHPAAVVLGALLVSGMAFSVIATGGHYFDEVVGGLLLAALFASIALSAPAASQPAGSDVPVPIRPVPL